MPERIRMTRRQPWRADHPTAIKVDRSTRFGNPFGAAPARPGETPRDKRARVVDEFQRMLHDPAAHAASGYPSDDDIRDALEDHDLACWCPLDGPCHADVLLERANPSPSPSGQRLPKTSDSITS